MDSANSWPVFWRIAFPLVRPAAFVLGLFVFVSTGAWWPASWTARRKTVTDRTSQRTT